MQRKEALSRIREIVDYSQEILDGSTDLIVVDETELERVLIPRLVEFMRTREANKFLPASSKLPLEQELGLNLFLNAINFCYQDPDSGHEYVFNSAEGKTIKRATGLATALAESGIDWDDLGEVRQLTPDRWSEVAQIGETNCLYLGEERGDRIVRLAEFLYSEGYSTVRSFIADCDYDATILISKLMETGLFEDRFLKRAQLAVRMLDDALSRRSAIRIANIDKLTVMADYRIPQVFYNLGAVKIVDQSLLARLTDHEPIEAGSREELALRSTCVVLGKKIADRLGITEAEADDLLWSLSQQMVRANEMTIPHMLVATDAH